MQTNEKDTSLRNAELDEELAGILMAISVVSKRLAEKLLALQRREKPTEERGTPDEQDEKTISLEEVRSVLAEKSRNGQTAKVRELLEKHGASKLSEINPKNYADMLAEAREFGDG